MSDPLEIPNQQTFGQKLRAFARKRPPKQRLAVVSGISLGVLVFGVALIQAYGPEAPEPDPIQVVENTYVPPPVEPETEPSTLTGVLVSPTLNQRPVTAVMIENSIDARPQAGLSDAGVVFEAIAEGGITRFLALYQTEQPEHIGPIRSARPYYVRWAAGFDAAYVHSGGSPEALSLVRSLGLKDMDHGNYAGSFERVSNRYAPHNVYTSMARLDALRGSLGFKSSDFSGFSRVEVQNEDGSESEDIAEPLSQEPPATKTPATTIEFDISSPRYNTSYTYNSDTQRYARVMAGAPHLDERSKEQIQPSVVIALEASYSIHSNNIHSVYGIVGQGDATIFQNGEAIAAKWSKPTDTAELSFEDTAGKTIALQPGQTWITAIHNDRFSFN